jgi:hypothetical protein
MQHLAKTHHSRLSQERNVSLHSEGVPGKASQSSSKEVRPMRWGRP